MGWINSLHCKSKAVDDVVLDNRRRRHHQHDHSLPHSSSCKNSVQNLKDIVETTKQAKPKNKPNSQKPSQTRPFKRPVSKKPEPGPNTHPPTRTRPGIAESVFPALNELPEGHPSRNVVEIIFHTRWGENNFSGRIEMVFKVQNLTRTVTRFEEYREAVKSRASCGDVSDGSEDHTRCVADGNEVMRFYCLGATAKGGAYEKVGGAWVFQGGKGGVVSMYSGSGVAHQKAGGGKGPRAMLVCRVIAGRVCKKLKFDSLVEGRVGYDSVGGENGELIVFDSRALLPCFLVIYEL